MQQIRPIFRWLTLSLLAAPAWASVETQYSVLLGPRGYVENDLSVTAEKAYEDRVVSSWWMGARGTSYADNNVSSSFRGELSVGAEIRGNRSLDMAVWMMPRPNDRVGAYRASGVRITGSVWGPGWLPSLQGQDEENRDVHSELSLFVSHTRHEETLGLPGTEAPFDDNPGRNRGSGSLSVSETSRFPGTSAFSNGADDTTAGTAGSSDASSRRSLKIQETIVGTTLVERFRKKTSVRGTFEKHLFDQDLESLAHQLDVFTLLNAENAASLDLLNGFTDFAWGFGVDQQISPWLKAGADFRRATYVIGISSWADTYRLKASLYWHALTLRPVYEIFKLRGRAASSYYGLTAVVSF